MSPAHNPFTLFSKTWANSAFFKTKKKRGSPEEDEMPSQILGNFSSKQLTGILNDFSKPGKKSLTGPSSSRLYRSAIKRYRYPWQKTINIDSDKTPAGTQSFAELDLPEGVYSFELIKPQNGHLGIQIIGGSDTSLGALFIQDILPDTPASKSEYFRIGDQILSVNDKDLEDTTHKEAFRIFTTLPAVVKMTISRNKSSIYPKMPRKNRPVKALNNNNECDSQQRVDKDLQGLMDRAVGASKIPQCVSAVVDVKHAHENGTTDENEDTNNTVTGAKSPLKFLPLSPVPEEPSQDQQIYFDFPKPLSDDSPGNFDHEGTKEDVQPKRKLRRSNSMKSTRRPCKDIATWPLTAEKTRSTVNDSTFQPPSYCSLRRTNSARVQRSSSVIYNRQHFLGTLERHSEFPFGKRPKYIWKTHVIELTRSPTGWGIDVGGGVGSPYGIVPIYVREVYRNGSAHGVLRKGDEILSFSNINFEEITYQKAIRLMEVFQKNSSTVIIRRRQLKQSAPTVPLTYAELWGPLPGNTSCGKRSRPKSDNF